MRFWALVYEPRAQYTRWLVEVELRDRVVRVGDQTLVGLLRGLGRAWRRGR